MCADCLPAGLLRVAGLPVAVLAQAGNPGLFDRIRDRQRSEVDYAEFAVRLAARLTGELVPRPDLTAKVRGLAVDTRRRLLRGQPVAAADCRRLAVVNAVLDGGDSLTGDLLRAAAWSRDLLAEDLRLTAAVAREQARLATLPWELVTRFPAAMRVVTDAAPDLPGEIRDRLAAGAGWTDKRMRQRADYLLRLLARAAGKTTPRGWLGHVAMVRAGTGADDQLLVGARVGDYAVHTVGNIGEQRRALAAGTGLPDVWLSMTGLHWTRDDRLCCWVDDPDNPAGARFVRVRRTQAVDVVRQALGAGAVRTSDVIALLAPTADATGRTVVRDFLHHLVRLGVVQASARPDAQLRGWSATPPAVRARGFVDVYRRGAGHVSAPALGRLGELVTQASRVHAVLARPAPAHPVLAFVGDRPRPVTEIVARFLDECPPRPPQRRHPAWPAPEPGTVHQRLWDWLGEHADHGEADLTAAVLDRIGAPPAVPRPWPVDCLVRPLTTGKPLAVLEAVLPAGVADARFADALRGLHDDVSPVDAYRTFLDATAASCGVEFVEILVPPHGIRGANTVRRPRYTRAWTGDADLSTYLADHPTPGRFLPLSRITVRRDGGRVVAEDTTGRPLWPVCHATRVPPPPWDVVMALLTAAAPVGRLAAPFLPGDHTAAFPGRERAPRLVLDGGLVLAPRSVILRRDRLPRHGAPIEARVRSLAHLRTATGAPRWNFVRAQGSGRSRPVDLDSVTALRVVDRLLADPAVPALVFEEMLPDPDHLPVREATGEPLAAQLLVRLPHGTGPTRLADDVARALRPLERSHVDSAMPAVAH
jgi:hypothetical protein